MKDSTFLLNCERYRPKEENSSYRIYEILLRSQWESYRYNNFTTIIDSKINSSTMKLDSSNIDSFLNENPNGESTSTTPTNIDELIRNIESRDLSKGLQRNASWQENRILKVTASECWRALGSKISMNSFIEEKVKKYNDFRKDSRSIETRKFFSGPLIHGETYEPVAKWFFENLFFVRVRDNFGVIRHKEFDYLGASPDGLIVSSHRKDQTDQTESIKSTTTVPQVGELLEIKCPTSRNLSSGIETVPTKYFHQMQMQMETCEIPVCNYFEVIINETSDLRELTRMIIHHLYLNKNVPGKLQDFGILKRISEIGKKGKPVAMINRPFYLTELLKELQISIEFDLSLFEDPSKEEYENYVYSKLLTIINHVRTVPDDTTYLNPLKELRYFHIENYSYIRVQRNMDWLITSLPRFQECHERIKKYLQFPDEFEAFVATRERGSSSCSSSSSSSTNLSLQPSCGKRKAAASVMLF